MQHATHSFIAAAVALGLLIAVPAAAADKDQPAHHAKRIRVVENDKLRAFEVHFKPGDEDDDITPAYRIVRAIRGGTLERQFPDGKTEKAEWKTGEFKALSPAPSAYKPKNIGKAEVVLYVVEMK